MLKAIPNKYNINSTKLENSKKITVTSLENILQNIKNTD
jgi:hypothetical protein